MGCDDGSVGEIDRLRFSLSALEQEKADIAGEKVMAVRELDRLRAENEKLTMLNNVSINILTAVNGTNDKLRAENAKLREALEWIYRNKGAVFAEESLAEEIVIRVRNALGIPLS